MCKFNKKCSFMADWKKDVKEGLVCTREKEEKNPTKTDLMAS